MSTEVTTYSGRAVAGYFLHKAKQENKAPDRLQMMKLAYLAHGWCLGIFNKPLVSEEIEAWLYGPTIRVLYNAVQNTKTHTNTHTNTHNVPTNLFDDAYRETSWSQETKELLDAVWVRYKKYSGLELSGLCHAKGSPWFQVNEKKAIIANEIIKAYYKDLWVKISGQRSPGMD